VLVHKAVDIIGDMQDKVELTAYMLENTALQTIWKNKPRWI
jgi:hypothetical protein